MNMMTDPERIPVIIGVGQLNDRPESPELGLDPPGLMAAALRLAADEPLPPWGPRPPEASPFDQLVLHNPADEAPMLERNELFELFARHRA